MPPRTAPFQAAEEAARSIALDRIRSNGLLAQARRDRSWDESRPRAQSSSMTPTGICFDGNAVWIANKASNNLLRR
jgi:hypothetical protein